MRTVLILFHHAQGLTTGVHALADDLRAAGHRVTVPDLYDGATFADLAAGVAHAEALGMDTIIAQGEAAAAGLPDRAAYVGLSLGALPAQKLAQTRPGALAAILLHGGTETRWFGGPWPAGVALQVHLADPDDWTEREEAESLVAEAAGGELFLYPGAAHLFTDRSLDAYDEGPAELVLGRALALLSRWP